MLLICARVLRQFQSIDYVSRHMALDGEGTEAKQFAEIYQQLGLAWKFLALQCRHWFGWRAQLSFMIRICAWMFSTDTDLGYF